jgi:two-component system phosphate regulon response regulator OmpR
MERPAMTALTLSTAPRAAASHILVIDDDKRIRTLLSRFLTNEGYRVSAAANAAEATLRMRDLAFDLIVLDVMMPGESGTQFVARLRKREEPLRSAPILMLTARNEIKDRVEGLEAGVDDYLAKPFEPRELALRIASILRRTRSAKRPVAIIKMARFGDYTFDLIRGELSRFGDNIRLTTRECEILRALASAEGDIVSRERLALRAEGDGGDRVSERSVDVEIARLRRKIEDDPSAPRHLQTVRGQGYRLLAEQVDDPSAETGTMR